MTTTKPVHVPTGKGAESLTTKQLIRGMYVGFRFSMFEMEAAAELKTRGEIDALHEVIQSSPRKFAVTSARRTLGIKRTS